MDDPRLIPDKPGISIRLIPRASAFFLPMLFNVGLNLLFPIRRREWIIRNGENKLESMPRKYVGIEGDRWQRLAKVAAVSENTMLELRPLLIPFISGVASGMVSFATLNNLANMLPKDDGVSWKNLVLEMTSGLSYNPTSQMDLDLWKVAQAIRKDSQAFKEFSDYSAPELSTRFLKGTSQETIYARSRSFS